MSSVKIKTNNNRVKQLQQVHKAEKTGDYIKLNCGIDGKVTYLRSVYTAKPQ